MTFVYQTLLYKPSISHALHFHCNLQFLCLAQFISVLYVCIANHSDENLNFIFNDTPPWVQGSVRLAFILRMIGNPTAVHINLFIMPSEKQKQQLVALGTIETEFGMQDTRLLLNQAFTLHTAETKPDKDEQRHILMVQSVFNE